MRAVGRHKDRESSSDTEEGPLLRNGSKANAGKLGSFIWKVGRKSTVKSNSENFNPIRHRRSWTRVRRWHVRARRRLCCWFYVQRRWLKNCASRWIAQIRRGMLHNGNSVLHRVFFQHRERQLNRAARSAKVVPRGFIPVYVGQEQERFVIPVDYLHHPLFQGFLKAAEQEFGYHQNGGLIIPCSVTDFRETTLQMKDNQMLSDRHHYQDEGIRQLL